MLFNTSVSNHKDKPRCPRMGDTGFFLAALATNHVAAITQCIPDYDTHSVSPRAQTQPEPGSLLWQNNHTGMRSNNTLLTYTSLSHTHTCRHTHARTRILAHMQLTVLRHVHVHIDRETQRRERQREGQTQPVGETERHREL